MRKTGLFFLVLLLGCIPLSAHAVTYTASGTGTDGHAISASAAFDFVSYDFASGSGLQPALQITLTNTSSEPTSHVGNLLTGFFFSLDGVGALSTTSAGFDGRAATVLTSRMAPDTNVDIAPAASGTGMYQLSNGPFGTANSGISYSAFSYGIATVGSGLAGFSGLSGGDNYGIAAAGSNLTLDGLPNALPLIDTTAIFWILRPEELDNLSQLTNARFAFGSLPDNKLDLVPIPGSLILFGSGLLGLVGIGRKRLKK